MSIGFQHNQKKGTLIALLSTQTTYSLICGYSIPVVVVVISTVRLVLLKCVEQSWERHVSLDNCTCL